MRVMLEQSARLVADEPDVGTVWDLRSLDGTREGTGASFDEVVSDATRRLGGDVSVLDWTDGASLCGLRRDLTVFAPPLLPADRLPYLDETIDVVFAPSADPVLVSEATRVAKVGVAIPSELRNGSMPLRWTAEWKLLPDDML